MPERPTLDGIRQASSGAFSKAKLMVGLKNEDDIEEQSETSSFLDEAVDIICPDLSFQQRVIGFAATFTLGYLITFMSFKFFVELVEGYPVPFALNYSFGNVLSLASSWFLCGPKAQFKNMMDDRRRLTSITYLSCLATTLAVVFIPIKSSIKLCILLILLFTQFAASFWYSLSYVPYGRKTVLKILKRTFGLNDSSPVEGIVS